MNISFFCSQILILLTVLEYITAITLHNGHIVPNVSIGPTFEIAPEYSSKGVICHLSTSFWFKLYYLWLFL